MNPKPKAATDNAIKKKKRRSPVLKFILTVTKILIVFFIAVTFAIAGVIGGAIYGYIKTAPPITDDQLMLKNFTTFIYDSKNPANEIAQLKGEQNRIWVDDKDIPKYLKDAFVAIEDERFYDHPGIDIRRIASAVLNLGKNGGGSTITQQVIKNLTGDTQRSLQRKVQEQWRALQLEKKLAKWQILELYMNLIYMGTNNNENSYGVQSAAKMYFNKSVKDLDLAECASLAGITNLPGKYNPLTTDGRKNNKERQKLVLGKMKELGYITPEEYDQAMNEELKFVQGNQAELKNTSKQSYFVDKVISDVRKDLIAKGISAQIADKTIYNNGLKIYTTMDSDVQKEMDSVFKDDKFFPVVNKNAPHPQAAMVIVDPKNGQVKALYGGYGEKKADMVLNRATQIKRQPGSTFKPIAVYGPAIDQKLITAATIIDDVPVYMNGVNKPRYPENYDKTFRGLTNIHDAIRDSVNVVAAKVWKDILGPDLSLQYLKRVGLNRDKEGYVSIAMGGLNQGVNTLDMASAYVPFDNKGMFFEPSTYTRVEDKDGNVILEKKPKSNIVYDETSAYIMTNMMRDVVRLGTAYPYGMLQEGKMPTAGKTGTTGDNKDKWFVGFSPYYIGATWYGYDNPVELQKSEYNQALILWHEVMERIHKNIKPVEFVEPPGLVKKTICIYSGKSPTDLCEKDPRNSVIGSIRYNELFIKGTEPKDGDFCDVHVKANICKDSKDIYNRNLLFGPNCPQTSLIEQIFIKRKEPYKPIGPYDPYPKDWQYELPEGEYCNVHAAPSLPKSTIEPSSAAGSTNNSDPIPSSAATTNNSTN